MWSLYLRSRAGEVCGEPIAKPAEEGRFFCARHAPDDTRWQPEWGGRSGPGRQPGQQATRQARMLAASAESIRIITDQKGNRCILSVAAHRTGVLVPATPGTSAASESVSIEQPGERPARACWPGQSGTRRQEAAIAGDRPPNWAGGQQRALDATATSLTERPAGDSARRPGFPSHRAGPNGQRG
jgi:hypothetical protein